MSATSTIEWTDATWNPVTGCTKVSEGCDHCYAERITNRFGGPGAFDTVVLHPDRLEAPLRWRKPRRVFVNSMSDLFHDDVPDEFIRDVFAIMALARHRHTFQVLTKRPGRMASLMARLWGELELSADAMVDDLPLSLDEKRNYWRVRGSWHGFPTPLRNVWLGTSVENQKWADVRVPKLLETPAAVRFLSCEPLLEPVDLSQYLYPNDEGIEVDPDFRRWVIVGGESGPGARPMELDWLASIVAQCDAAGVPVFVKQDSGPKPGKQGRIPDDLWAYKAYPVTEITKSLVTT